MREFTFDLVYEPGADPLVDVFADHPELVAQSLDGCTTGERFWRIERFRGPGEALDAVEGVRLDGDRPAESVTEAACVATRYHDVLADGRNERVIYSYLDEVGDGETVHTLAGRHLDDGLLFETHRFGDTHRWRILMRSDRNVGLLYDNLGARLRDGLSFRMGHLREASGWQGTPLEETSVAPEQRRALTAAVEAGYYEIPRAVSLDDLADDLDVPRSTLSYRLRRAEERLAVAFVER